MIYSNKPAFDVILLTETWLCNDIPDSMLDPFSRSASTVYSAVIGIQQGQSLSGVEQFVFWLPNPYNVLS